MVYVPIETSKMPIFGPYDKMGLMEYYAPGPDGNPVPIDTARHKTVYGTSTTKEVVIRDLRSYHHIIRPLSLDKHGFELHRVASVEKDFRSPDRVKEVYYPECVELLKEITGAHYVHIDTSLIRRDPFDKVLEHMEKDGSQDEVPAPTAPARHVHLDVSSDEGASVTHRTMASLPCGIQDDLRGRPFAIVNIWRPIKTIMRDPLAIADASSVGDDELVRVPCFYVSPTGVGSVDSAMYKVTPEKSWQHRWYYVYKMDPDEVFVFKQYDSRKDVAGRCPHSSFVDWEFENRGLPARESIEIRAKVWF